MNDAEHLARKRYFMIVAVNLVATAGAVFGLVIVGRADGGVPAYIGGGLMLAALYVMAVVPRAMARRWKTPEE